MASSVLDAHRRAQHIYEQVEVCHTVVVLARLRFPGCRQSRWTSGRDWWSPQTPAHTAMARTARLRSLRRHTRPPRPLQSRSSPLLLQRQRLTKPRLRSSAFCHWISSEVGRARTFQLRASNLLCGRLHRRVFVRERLALELQISAASLQAQPHLLLLLRLGRQLHASAARRHWSYRCFLPGDALLLCRCRVRLPADLAALRQARRVPADSVQGRNLTVIISQHTSSQTVPCCVFRR